MKLWKAHGLGNDYLVLETADALSPERVRDVCDRHSGVGGDGILEPFDAGAHADFGVRIWNPDGSIAEKSGNGLRIFARWLLKERGAPSVFSLWTGTCKVGCRADRGQISVEMGLPSFAPSDVPIRSENEWIERAITLQGESVVATAVGMGNPHCVVFREEALDGLPWRRWGAELERHELFPNRTNVQIARVISEHEVEIRIHERGAGETQASGSSSCGVVAAGVRTGRLRAGRVRVSMPGGELFVTSSERGLLLEGPVEPIGRIEVDSDWLTRRRMSEG
ncbi:MAG TPA: diaminopimelate epimerase [Polyangiaceae bacterium]|nr:diaminopimelate epimerase [Polyangiaceae bacterium]